jgi:hypothetical protein
MPSLSLPQARADILTALVAEPRERCAIAAATQVQAPAGAVTVYDPADLIVAWSIDPAGCIDALRRLTGPQLTQQAIAHAALCAEQLGRAWSWQVVNDRWIALILEG